MDVIVKRTRKRLRAAARRIVTADEADDAVQMAYLSLVRTKRSFRDVPVMAWLMTAVIRIAYRIKAKRIRQHDLAALLATPSAPAGLPHYSFVPMHVDTQQRIRSQVDALPAPYRDVVVLHYLHGCPTAGVAQLLDVPERTVWTRLHRARALLRGRLSPGVRHTLFAAPWWIGDSVKGLATAGATVMTAKTSMSIVVSAVLVLVGGAVSWQLMRSIPNKNATRAEETSSLEADEPTAPVTLANPVSNDSPRAGDRHTSTPDVARPIRVPTHRLVGTLSGLDASLGDIPILRIEAFSINGPVGSLDPAPAKSDGTIDVDLSTLFADSANRPTQIKVSATSRLYMDATKVVSPSAESREPQTVPIKMTLALAGLVRGVVHGDDQRPLAEAGVALFADTNYAPRRERLAWTTTDAQGVYALKVRSAGRFMLVAAASNHTPAAHSISISPGREVMAPTLALGTGETQPGRITVNGTPMPGEARAFARVDANDATWLSIGKHSVVWVNGRPYTGRAKTRSDAEGRFVLGGLSPGNYVFRADKLTGRLVHMSSSSASATEVRVPSDPITLHVNGSWLTIEARDDGGLVSGIRLHVFRNGAFGLSTKENGATAPLLVARGGEYELETSAKARWAAYRETVTIPSDASPTVRHAIRLQAKPQRASLMLTIRTQDRRTVNEAGIRIVDLRARKPRIVKSRMAMSATDGVFSIDDVPAGSWTLIVRPGSHWFGGTSHYLEERIPLEMPRAGVARAEVKARRGGARLHLIVRDASGEACLSGCKIFDRDGRRVSVEFSTRLGESACSSPNGFTMPGWKVVDPALPAGEYTLEFSWPKRSVHRERVTLVAGKTTEHEVTLPR